MGKRGRPSSESELEHLMSRFIAMLDPERGDPEEQLYLVGDPIFNDKHVGLSSCLEIEVDFGGAAYRLILSRRNSSSGKPRRISQTALDQDDIDFALAIGTFKVDPSRVKGEFQGPNEYATQPPHWSEQTDFTEPDDD